MATAIQESLTEKQTISSSVSQALPGPCPQPASAWLLAFPMPQVSCVLSLATSWDSKQQILKDTVKLGPTPLQGRRALQHCTWHCSVPEKQLHACVECLESMLKHRKKLPQVVCPLCVPLAPAVEQTRSALRQVFCPWRGNTPASKCTPGKGMFSPRVTQGIPTSWSLE